MWRKKASNWLLHSSTRSTRLGQQSRRPLLCSPFSSQTPPPGPAPQPSPKLHNLSPPPPFSAASPPQSPLQFQSSNVGAQQQYQNFTAPSRPALAPNVPPKQSPPPPPPPGTDYLTFFQPRYGNALTGLGAYSPGSVLKLSPLPRFVLKEDILHHLRGSNLRPENIKFVYNPLFRPDYAQFEVDSLASQRQIMRRLQERRRFGCRFLRAEVSSPMPYSFVDAVLKDSPRGRTLVMWNVSPNTTLEDVERFFYGYSYDASCIHLINQLNNSGQFRGAVNRRPALHVAVGFSTKLEALRALRERTGDFCLNVAINLRLVQ